MAFQGSPRSLILALVSGVVAFPQVSGPTPQTATAIPETVLYRALFRHVAAQERFADHLDAEHKRSDHVRSQTRTQASLTLAEDTFLKSTAKHWVAVDRSYSDQSSQLSSNSQPDSAATRKALAAQRQAALLDHIQQLKDRLGPDRFKVLDAYVQSTIAPNVHLFVQKKSQ